MAKFNNQILLASTIVFVFLLIPCFIAAGSEDEGMLGTNIIGVTFAKLFYVLRFPTHTLFWDLFSSNTILYFLGLLMNCIFYGFITERLITYFNSTR